ncbi:hypothetical protein KDW_42910 [Dictyobacter vulcani]|uniref:Carrier domain-containing protein n=1 Tax=Dictyobacter vulcani TaxID=2607529 RepID=A0A5J4KVJ4_9CHLR|nr:non-ribosomal peptide synthetase [Dictyobacter vulcani]GER90129.1 hypothetical protein KDW_42910 [Dictyobacter vulcani]
MTDLSQRLAGLSPEKRALLTRQLKEKGKHIHTFPLSFAQQRLWLLDQLEPGNPSYNIVASISFQGALHLATLREGLQFIVSRHEDLRTTFRVIRDEPVQVIIPNLHLTLPLVDLRHLPEAERMHISQHLANAEANYSFDLSQGPLIRCTLLCVSQQEFVLLLNVHHIVFDGWSLNIFMTELAQFYTAHMAGTAVSLPQLPLQYADYAVWQRKWLAEQAGQDQLAYWKRTLHDIPTLLELPTDRPRPAIQSYRGANIHTHLSRELSQQLRQRSQQEGVTLFMTLLALFQIILARYAGQEKLAIGTPIANRNRAELESLIGFFVNTLVIRADLSRQPTFSEFLQQVRETLLGAYTHQDISFDRLLEELNPQRSLSYSPLFQVLFNMTNLPTQENSWSGLKVSTAWPQDIGSKFDLTLFVNDTTDTIQLDLVYNMDLFERERMQEFLRQYERLAWQVMQRDENIYSYSLVTEHARSLLPDPATPLSSHWEGPIYQLISRHAQSHPVQLALVDETQQVSYQELETYSNRLGYYLQRQKIVQGDVVGLMGTRSAALVCALLGILKAGATVLLLDPAYPAERLALYAQLAHIRYAISITERDDEEENLLTLPAGVQQQRLSPQLDQDWLAAEESLGWQSTTAITADDIAFITFTSGSTGQPKGVMQRHGPLSHFLPWQQQHFGLSQDDHHSMLSGVAHDPLQREIFTALGTGATLYIAAPERVGEPGWLANWMKTQHITITSLTPSTLQLLVPTADSEQETGHTEEPAVVRYTFFVGDVLSKRHVAQLRAFAPAATVVNFYGSTETQRSLGYFTIPAVQSDQADPLTVSGKEVIPLGKGIPDVQLLLLNRVNQLAGIGELSEIVFQSPHLAAGYLDQPELTEQRFQQDIVTGTNSGRSYRSGDLGRYLPDGNVEFAGRRDEQIKLRGFRIEPGEIEATLLQFPAITEVKVLLREDTPDHKQLVAYLGTGVEDGYISHAELRAFLAQHLPTYMVPSAFVLLARLPRTPNAKIDLHALPVPDRPDAAPEQEPQTALEKELAPLWLEILHIPQIDRDANFFELGGHSILATRLLARVQRNFQVTVTLRTLFETPTLAGLARAIEQAQQKKITSAIPGIKTFSSCRPES